MQYTCKALALEGALPAIAGVGDPSSTARRRIVEEVQDACRRAPVALRDECKHVESFVVAVRRGSVFLSLGAIAEKKVSNSYVDACVAACEVMSRMSSKGSRVKCACWQIFLATGVSMRSLAFQFRICLQHISRIIKDVLKAVHKNMLSIAKKFSVEWNFPNAIGSIDGKHNYYSIVLLAIVDADCKFVAVDQSSFGKKIRESNFNIPPPTVFRTDRLLPHVLVGDGTFALSQTMMKPYSHKTATADECKRILNYRLCRTRTSENAFGILGQVFRIFYQPIAIDVATVDYLIMCCYSLHKMIREECCCAQRTQDTKDKGFQHPQENLIPLRVRHAATLRMWVNEFANNSQNTFAMKVVFRGRRQLNRNIRTYKTMDSKECTIILIDGDSYLTSTDRRATDSPFDDQSLPEVPDRPLHTGFYRRVTVLIFSELPPTLAMASHAL
ncbi:hypothetical protein PR048_022011 [Dryococelus australis]|uniref:DDE Tnp4 domain-containing protein n=1 Tax=Dryococelus australis TaxID=614101 RepID=A0ABQ9GZV9_9NEOP|nr:hypothetical protein PR048_022011 [Dryococelus australis]